MRNIDIESIKLRIEKIMHLQVLALELVDSNFTTDVSLSVLFDRDECAVRSIYRLVTYEELLGQYPADWWQALKERWFPGWLLKRYPVKWTKLIAKHKFPHYAIPNLGREYVEVMIRKPEKQDEADS